MELPLEVAERVCGALTEIAGGYRKDDAALRGGFLGVGVAGPRLVCRYDAAVAPVTQWQSELRERVGDEADLVDWRPIRGSAAQLADLFAAVAGREWHPDARSYGLTASVDPDREVVEVGLDHRAPADLVDALRRLGGEQVDVRLTGPIHPRIGRRVPRPGR